MNRVRNAQKLQEYIRAIQNVMEFWHVRNSILEDCLKIYGAINSVNIFKSYEKNVLPKKFHLGNKRASFLPLSIAKKKS